ncbi:unnamed protein product [Urochloa humidicola]
MGERETPPRLPDDALAAILRRLPQRTLAESRRVCKAWRAVVDTRGLLRPHLLPHAVRGIFVNFVDYRCPRFFARPSAPDRPAGIDGNLHFLPEYSRSLAPIVDHCNGLLLYGRGREFIVVNPATRRWELLSPRIELRDYVAHLVFDPAISPHYKVVLIPSVPQDPRETPPPFDLHWLLSSLGDDTEEQAPRSIGEGFFPKVHASVRRP